MSFTKRRHHFKAKSVDTVSSLSRYLSHPISLVLWIGVCVLISASLWNSIRQMEQSKHREDDVNAKIKLEETKGLELIDQLEKADTSYAQEKIIRDQLGLQKPGETILQIPKQ
jgi:cell division protein FtsB